MYCKIMQISKILREYEIWLLEKVFMFAQSSSQKISNYEFRFTENARCPFADKCTHAHSVEELEEWKERFKFKRHQLQLAKEKHLHGNTYPEQLMEKLMTTEYPKSVVS